MGKGRDKIEMTIDSYSEKYAGEFEKIWVGWLKNSMNLEPQEKDLEEVRNPLESYIKNGGMVFYAANDNEDCIGVVAVKKLNPTDYEFCKLVVDEKARGLGLGKKLVQKCIDFVEAEGGKNLFLQSFYKLEIALKMYRSMGFVESEAPDGMFVVERTEIIMKKPINLENN